jgi:hypothetical protein
MGLNLKKYYAGATAKFSDFDGTGAQTLATTTKLPENAIVNEVSIYCQQAITSSGALEMKVTGGGVDLTTAIAKASLLDEAVVTAMGTLPVAGKKTTSAADIGLHITHAVTDPSNTDDMLQIRVGYFLGTAE